MKAIYKNSMLVLLASALVLASCTKSKDVKAYLTPGTAPMFNSSITTLVLVQANAASNAGNFFWTAADFGYKAAITYTIQFTKAGTNFAPATTVDVAVGSGLSKTFTVQELNAKMLDIMPYGVATDVHARLKADVGSGVPPIYSNVITNLKITAYRDIINYVFPQALHIAGNYQGWDPGSAPKIVDKLASGTTGSNYEGYINFTDGAPHPFKMVKGNNWGAGDFGSAGGSNLGNGGPDLNMTGAAGVFLIRANTNNMTWNYTRIATWGLIGSAVPGTGWNSSAPMTFVPSTGSWTLTLNLIGGQEIKFRANDDWGINFGDNHNPAGGVFRDNKPDYGGDNIPIAADGNYTITLDIGIAGNYSYKIVKN